ncbi:PASTA domain-containing protein [Mucilaginibacter gotjawali]|uniref:Serine/threonine-protein kinase PrkC n=2 Tax=Mucilaginibacter gotjawali TaxID=1550579 RepID=A0A110B3P7_9SPHI|nr:PASTA domain-containing protein [Mucilaginibacter gotjawali]MBB3058196.1 beta-lactam-binding protein with PASTA domain [Mucilaginibacter gotjawali]BAU54848.1 Serine/threonine-protein kinase PrkC [Mucilaginibacter gotjawali]
MNKFWIYLKTKQFRNTLLLIVGSVFALVLIMFFSLGAYTRHGTGVPVPHLKGMDVDKAIQLLKDQGFDYKIDSVYVLDKPPGAVIEQDPDPGTNVKENRTIYLTVVTRLAPPVAMPDLTPYTYREAVATLANYGLKVGDTTYKSDIARDRVLEMRFAGQPLLPNSKIPKGSRIDLVLGNGAGASQVDIPELVNLALDEGKFAIRHSGLTLGTITYQGPITDSANLVIVAQSPMKTDSISKTANGTPVNLTVTQGKKSDAQPN